MLAVQTKPNEVLPGHIRSYQERKSHMPTYTMNTIYMKYDQIKIVKYSNDKALHNLIFDMETP